MDYPLTRKSHHCPLCDGPKDLEIVACWPCYREYGMRNGNPDAESMIAQYEACLQELVS